MITVIVINGAGTSGKDTFIDLFTEVVNEDSIGTPSPVCRFSSVDEVKSFATIMGWDGVKDDKGRRFLSDIKDALTRYSDAPYRYMEQKVQEFSSETENGFIFFHVREPSEIEKMVQGLHATTLLIQRDEVQPSSFDNHADKNVHSYPYDYCVRNNGTLAELKEEARSFLKHLIYFAHLPTGGESKCQP